MWARFQCEAQLEKETSKPIAWWVEMLVSPFVLFSAFVRSRKSKIDFCTVRDISVIINHNK
jgi:hypothetical protein